jgi:hypothetical protein
VLQGHFPPARATRLWTFQKLLALEVLSSLLRRTCQPQAKLSTWLPR